MVVPAALPLRNPNRFELKYWIPETLAADVARFIAPHTEPDAHVQSDPRGQCITTLYLDTPGHRFFRAHVENQPDRFKLRVRAYGEIPSGLAFFEIKRKVNHVILKSRAAVSLESATALLEGTYRELPPLADSHRHHLESFLCLQATYGALPVVLVRYHREAYANEAEDIRATLDRCVCSQPACGASLDADPRAWLPFCDRENRGTTEPCALLELKFPALAPAWMGHLIARLRACRQGFSKYARAMRAILDQSDSDASLADAQAHGGF